MIKIETKKPFMTGLIFVIFVLNALFDIGNNYSAYLFGFMNDFNVLKESSSNLLSNLIGISFFITSAVITILIIKKYKGYPVQKTKKHILAPSVGIHIAKENLKNG